MNRDNKKQLVTELHDKLQRAQAVFLADFRGMNVEQATKLRDDLRKADVEYKVVKNTLLERASRETDKHVLESHLAGPTALAMTYSDPVAAAKVLSKYAKEQEKIFKLKVGVLSGKLMSVRDIQALADLPSREVLLARLLGSIQAPVSNFVGVLAAVPGSFVRVLGAIKQQKEGN